MNAQEEKIKLLEETIKQQDIYFKMACRGWRKTLNDWRINNLIWFILFMLLVTVSLLLNVSGGGR